jgi:hypothetical protein
LERYWNRKPCGTFSSSLPYLSSETSIPEDCMKAYLAKLSMRTWLLLLIPAVLITYPIVRIVLPEVIRAVVPEAVRSALSVI